MQVPLGMIAGAEGDRQVRLDAGEQQLCPKEVLQAAQTAPLFLVLLRRPLRHKSRVLFYLLQAVL